MSKLANDILIEIAANYLLVAMVLAAGMIIHCFYDERITITRRKVLALFIEMIVMELTMLFAPSFITDSVILMLLLFFLPVIIVMWGSRNGVIGHLLNFGRIMLCQVAMLMCAMLSAGRAAELMGILKEEDYLERDNLYFILTICVIPTLIILVLYFSCVRKGITMPLRRHDKFFLFVYCIIMLMAMGNIEGEFEFDSFKPVMGLFTVLIAVSIPALIFKNRQSAYFSELSAHNESFLEAEIAASKQYRDAQEETRAFRHDIKNELTMLSALMREKRYDEAEGCLNDMLDNVSALSPKIVTGDDMLDSLISSKLSELEERGIDLTVKGVIDGGLEWKPIDICSVFANAIDNAAEACDKLPEGAEKYIRIAFRKTELQRMISVKNPTSEKVDVAALNSGAHHTSKKDKAHHGYGVGNIRRTAEKYGGMLNITCENGEFSLSIVFMK
ncbi:sensor histidine kinase [Ruminococcus sp.]|uniref:sensor histidine kinase n=1 Tax=Ruminococcus sp. TaxID=41978 RepID=UPI0025E78705|nr:sensor histidine kinase [Ruminococcus sp.]MBQ8967962.1 GHKL domain-containing protein [Ruminococcus sp.]